MSDKNKKILTTFELTTDERAWLARNGNMAHELRRLIREDMEREWILREGTGHTTFVAPVAAGEEKDDD